MIQWKLSQPEDRDHFKPDVSDLQEKIVKVKMEAVIFNINSTQTAWIRPNRSKDKVR